MRPTTTITVTVAAIAGCLVAGCSEREKPKDTIVGAWTKMDGVPIAYVFLESGEMVYGGIKVRYEQPDSETLLIHLKATDTAQEAVLEYSVSFSNGHLLLENRHDKSDTGKFRRAKNSSEGWSNVKEFRITDRSGQTGKIYPVSEPPRGVSEGKTPPLGPTPPAEARDKKSRDVVRARPDNRQDRGVAGQRRVSVGDSKAQVIAALGQPRGTGGTPGEESLFYEKGWIDLENGRVVNIHLNQLATSVEALPPGTPRPEPQTSPGANDDSGELTDNRIAREVEHVLSSEHKVISSAVLSLKRSGSSVTCEFTADVRPRFIDTSAMIEPYSGPVKGSLELTPVGDSLQFKSEYESVPAGSFSANREGTITTSSGLY